MRRSILLILIFLFLSPRVYASEYDAVESHLNATADQSLAHLLDFLSFPSISALPANKADVRAAGIWLRDHLASIGLENTQLLESPLHPSVYADWLHAPDAPTVLIYAHYDVQPVDPLALWTSPPFEPTVRDGKVFARGASDDKGNLMIPVAVIGAYLKVLGKLPVNVKVFFEGEEEIGSPNIAAILRDHRDLLKADYSFSADGAQVDLDTPGLVLSLRGAVALEVTVRGGEIDLHSGVFGGGVQNPLHVLGHLLASMRDIQTGQVLVEGFYDDVDELTDEDRADIAEFPVSAKEIMQMNGVKEETGETGFSFYERTWCRPSLEVVGMGGGFQDDGVKTVLPREAKAKIVSRIVSSQSPGKVFDAIKSHIERAAAKVKGVTVEIEKLSFEANPFKMSKYTPGNVAATKVLTELYGKKPVFFRMGGSIPIYTHLQKHLGLHTTTFSFGNDDEKIHSPNEFSRIDSYRRGEIAYTRLLGELSKMEAKQEL